MSNADAGVDAGAVAVGLLRFSHAQELVVVAGADAVAIGAVGISLAQKRVVVADAEAVAVGPLRFS